MSIEVAVDVPQDEPVVEPEKDLAAELDKWKAMSRKNEARAKENESAAKRLAEIEDANRSELERVQARAEAAEKALAEREAEAERARLLAEVAEAKGVSAAVLRGDTREALEEHADLIISTFPTQPAVAGVGAAGNRGPDVSTNRMSIADKFAAAINERG